MRRLAAVSCTALALLAVASPAQGKTVYTLIGHGYGHGIGMGQYGALGFAEHGWKARRMLAHYYRGTRLGTLRGSARGRLERVLLARAGRISFASDGRMRIVDERTGRSHRLPAGAYRLVRAPRAERMRLLRARSRTIVVRRLSSSVLVKPRSEPLAYGSGHWHGSFRVVRSGGILSLIDVVPLERYLRGVVPSEMPASWPQAALRAQAIAARSYAVATRGGGSFDAYSDTRSQVYGPIEAEAPASTAAVRGTAHRVVVYRGHVATTYFSSSTGGVSASMQAAWGTSSGEPYLVPVRDPYDGARGANPYHTWTRTFGKTEMARLLDMRRIVSFSLSIDRRSRRVVEITFQSRRRSVTRPAGSLFGPLDLRSTYFTLRRVTLAATSPVRRRKGALLSGRILPRFAPRVRLQRRIPGAAWATVKRLRVARDGTFSLRVHPAGTRSYRLRLGRTVSPVVHVVVRGSGSVPARS